MVIIRITVEISSRLRKGSLIVHGLHFLFSGCIFACCLTRVRLKHVKRVVVILIINGKLPRIGSSTFKAQK